MRNALPIYDARDDWRGLEFTMTSTTPGPPPLRPEVTGARRFRIVQAQNTLLEAAISDDWCEVDLNHRGTIAPVIEPLRSDETRSIDSSDVARWWERWAWRLCDRLVTSACGPLHPGRWVLQPIVSTGLRVKRRPVVTLPCSTRVDAFSHVAEHNGEINSFSMHNDLVPLRPLSEPDGSRVKAWCKHVDSRDLPPVLVWWIAGLSSWVILDGHDRLVAALKRDLMPPVLALQEMRSIDEAHHRSGFDESVQLKQLNDTVSTYPDNPKMHEAMGRSLMVSWIKASELPRTTAWIVNS